MVIVTRIVLYMKLVQNCKSFRFCMFHTVLHLILVSINRVKYRIFAILLETGNYLNIQVLSPLLRYVCAQVPQMFMASSI